MQIKFNFNNFTFYGVSATVWQRAISTSSLPAVIGRCCLQYAPVWRLQIYMSTFIRQWQKHITQ